MGNGLQRANAAAKATQIGDEEFKFLFRLTEYEGAATSAECGLAFRPQDRARQKCRRLGLARYSGGYWRLTDEGKLALKAYKRT